MSVIKEFSKEQQYIKSLEKLLFFSYKQCIPYHVLVLLLSKNESIEFKLKTAKSVLNFENARSNTDYRESLKELSENFK